MSISIELGLFVSRLNSVCEEMGAALQKSSFSPNIKDRLDFSCAIFDAAGGLSAQAAHIPVHLGSMAFAMKDVVSRIQWRDGDVLVLNDPYRGGTHLPDVTAISPVFVNRSLVAFSVNRAHHANIGGTAPGSMPIASSLEEEGVVIEPTLLLRDGEWNHDLLDLLSPNTDDVRATGDFYAQASACLLGVQRTAQLVERMGDEAFLTALHNLNQYAEQLALSHWKAIPDGVYEFDDIMEDDGLGHRDLPIRLKLTMNGGAVRADFSGTASQVEGNINCPLSVAAAGVYYCFRCLLPDFAPACAGTFRPIEIFAERGSLLNAVYPGAVAAGNVETSSRVVDVVFGALAKALPERIGAASQGTMNNLAMGAPTTRAQPSWDYYETLAGGCGANPSGPGLSARHSHMTNTLNTPVESIESHFPVLITRYQLRSFSGGRGRHRGGDGIIREYRFLSPATVTLLTERRQTGPWGVGPGSAGQPGKNALNGVALPAKTSFQVEPGDVLRVETPGGGGWN